MKSTPPIVTLCLDSENYTRKPDKRETALIKTQIPKHEQDINISNLANMLVDPNGRTFSPAIYQNKSKSSCDSNWKGQQLIVLDIDKDLPFIEAKKRWERYGIIPCIVYSTFSDKDQTRYRLVFYFEIFIDSPVLFQMVIELLCTLFPEADSHAKSKSNIYFGGKELLFTDETFCSVTLPKLLNKIPWFLREHHKTNYSKKIIDLSKRTKIAITNNKSLQYKKEIVEREEREGEEGENNIFVQNQYLLYRGCTELFKIFLVDENKRVQTPIKRSTNSIEKYKRIPKERNINFSEVRKKCRLFDEFRSGKRWLYHNELFGLLTNFIHIQNGKAEFLGASGKKVERWRNLTKADKLGG